ncbi:Wzt carbohydrate-binding domain-containing protein [Planococcus sp. CP5-4]|uniref:BsuPI-related putative proteinase inhibitor n=1 Tax=unclassified Planococcus (in: firmicutes) TaxID=2662419 RepID=UPI001C221E4F|nr:MULTISPECIES: BsuPI-related putative proteinase inhibitor [unclassified Planococcus (in: firmicutes)]MBU9675045.1 Wzt carbohydrate-binding domain-containing protein [Planococcus sp. CP5-4_YE]MBV0910395.1 Wzt carbohydrate-binding domain-containing protein [Planococcus sp. CP5-4_UN]MBW6063829.1 Wzt carbohydrate-binding domain-containing protein [Planococcus sp. CP5-4]
MRQKNAIGWLMMLMAALMLAACGTESDNLPEDPDSGGEIIEGEVTSTIEETDNGTYRYTVKNDTQEAVTLNFTSGQRYDFTLTDEQGIEVFRMSSVSMYTQALGEEILRQGEELQYEIQVPEANLEPGTYTLEVWMTPTQGTNYPAEIEHTIE